MSPSSTTTHHHNSNSNSHRSTGSPVTSSGTPTQACAACKYQRRRCNPDCTLAPYFPADHQRQFLNAHHLFGVSKILKAIQSLDPKQRPQAMHSIMFHSDARAQDPVGGCYRIILEYERQIAREAAELDLVNRQLTVCRGQAQDQQQHQLSDLNINSPNFLTDNEDNTAAHDIICNNNHVPNVVQQQQQQLYYYYYGKNMYNEEMEPPPSSPLLINGIQQPQCGNDVKPFVELFDLRNQQFLAADDGGDSKGSTSFSCSARPEVKEGSNSTKDVGQEHDLKGAASLFSLNEDPNSQEENVQQEHDLNKDAAASLFTLNEEPSAMEEEGQEPDLKSTASFFSLKEEEEEPNTSEHVQEHDLKGAASLFTLTNFNTSTA